jgi:hypothetical protein
MELSIFLKSKSGNLLIPFLVILGIISLIKFGYKFGQWLFITIN